MLRQLWPALHSSGDAATLYYPAVCYDWNNREVAFPPLKIETAAPGEVGLTAVKSIFRNENNVIVSKDLSGIISVRIGGVSEDLLRTNISKITFTELAQYNYVFAIQEIEGTKEIKRRMEVLGMKLPVKPFDIMVSESDKSKPHLPQTLTNVSLEQTLDMIASTFKGVVMYGACKKPRLFEISFIGGANFDAGWLYRSDRPPH